MTDNYTVKIHDPVVVAHGEEVSHKGTRLWGDYQFPVVKRAAGNRIAVSFNMGKDSLIPGTYYSVTYVSHDGGASFSPVPNDVDPGIEGVKLPNGTQIQAITLPAVELDTVPLPPSPEVTRTFWGRTARGYLSTHFGGDWNKFAFSVNGQTKLYDIRMPDNFLRYVDEGVFAMPGFVIDKVSPDGNYWGACYQFFLDETDGTMHFQPFFIVSEDGGQTFTFRSTIPYRPDPSADPLYDVRDGFSEPQITFLPNGDIFCLMRTQDGNGNGPMYYAVSSDNGYTWTKPKVFSRFGVLPQIVTLNSGITIAAYGRPGVVVRTTSDPNGMEWDDEITIVDHADTCANTGMMAISDTEVLLAYSDFVYPDADGIPHRTVLVRKLEVIPNE